MSSFRYMGIATADRAADQYAQDQGDEDLLGDSVDRRTEELMQKGEDYYPWSIKNAREAISGFKTSEIDWKIFELYIRKRLPDYFQKQVRQTVIRLVHNYWAEKASDEAYKDIQNRRN